MNRAAGFAERRCALDSVAWDDAEVLSMALSYRKSPIIHAASAKCDDLCLEIVKGQGTPDGLATGRVPCVFPDSADASHLRLQPCLA
ncbi:hypothetical protein ABC383_25150 [Noviherbaspirillum sp. 1P10PC]|uniref:hypothetical protein n=1 Tax=Noviherbaspirillum sp. 1P10PC TaxID=3132292 RepID=UPI0039A15551